MGDNIIAMLRERELLQDVTDPGLERHLSENQVTVYSGFDPTADSLHVGHLVAVLVLRHFQAHGHRPIALLGGATGMVGDPSGRSAERNLLTKEQLDQNVEGLRGVLSRFLDFDGGAALLLNNHDWIGQFGFLEFLRDVGKHFRLSEMLAKDSVKRRLDSEAGISFTEFSYQLLQAYDFFHLYKEYNCTVQSGGSDQWGNITAGTELIRKLLSKQGFGITTPLLTNAQGEKMGKSASGAVWLTAEKFSPYDFYQYWIRQEDAPMERFLKMLTTVPLDEIAEVMAEHRADPSKRIAQKRLAAEMTVLVHGEDQEQRAREASEALFGGAISGKSDAEMRSLFQEAPSVQIPRNRLAEGFPVIDLLVDAGLCKSKKQAKQVFGQNGVYLNNSNDPWPQDRKSVTAEDLASESMMLVRTGKKNYCLVEFIE